MSGNELNPLEKGIAVLLLLAVVVGIGLWTKGYVTPNQDPILLIRAIRDNESDSNIESLSQRIKINGFDRMDQTAVDTLIIAIKADRPVAVKALLDHGVNPNGRNVLNQAVFDNRLEIVKILFDHGASLKEPDPLLFAVKADNAEMVKLLLDHGANPNARNWDDNRKDWMQPRRPGSDEPVDIMLLAQDWTALMLAAHRGNEDIIKLLLDKGAEVDATDSYGETALMHNTLHPKVTTLLLEHHASADTVSKTGVTPLMKMFMFHNLEAMKVLLEHGAKPDVSTPFRKPVLHMASETGNIEAVQLLLTYGADINNSPNYSYGYTPLMEACGMDALKGALKSPALKPAQATEYRSALDNQMPLMKLLLEKGANVNARNKVGGTVLMMAVSNCHDAIPLLMAAGADVNPVASDGYTTLHAAAYANDVEFARMLLSKGAKVDAKSFNGYTPLMTAAEKGSLDMLRLLLGKGANINAVNRDGETALFVAVRNKSTAVPALLAAGANSKATLKGGTTLLHYAALGNNTDAIPILLKQGLGINEKNSEGYTALMWAASNGNLDAARVLLKHGAAANLKNRKGQTARDIAIASNHFDFAGILY